ncbi:hypothetical protein D3C75_830840 [compost metagenome]
MRFYRQPQLFIGNLHYYRGEIYGFKRRAFSVYARTYGALSAATAALIVFLMQVWTT